MGCNLGIKQTGSFSEFKRGLSEPPMHFAPHEFWFWEQSLSKLGLKPLDMAHELYEKGFNPGYAHARQNYAEAFCNADDYMFNGKPVKGNVSPLKAEEWLSPHWFEEIGKVMDQAKKDGSCFSVADDFCWPSLQAGGRVLENYPDMTAKSLTFAVNDLKQGDSIVISDDGFTVAGRIDEMYPSDYIEFSAGEWSKKSYFMDESKPHELETRPYNFGAKYTKDIAAYAVYHPFIREAGEYDLYATWCECGDNTADAVYTVVNGEERIEFHIDQRQEALTWKFIGRVRIATGAYIKVTNAADGTLCIDAIRLDDDCHRIVVDDLDTLNRTRAVIVSGTLRLVEGTRFCAEDGNYRVYSFLPVPTRGYDGSRVDNLDLRLAERFTRLAYEPYFNELGEYTGPDGPFQGFFADTEGGFGFKLAWSNDLEKQYQHLTGRPIKTDLPLMMDESSDGFEAVVRCAWYETASDIFTEQFAHQSRLCEKHGMYFTMHTWEESLPFQANQVGSYFKLNRGISLPGTDALCNVAYNASNFWDTFSVAELEDRRYMVEMMALEGVDKYNFSELKRQINYLAAWGVSHIITHSLKMTRALAQDVVTPEFYNIDPSWKHMKNWTDYVRRISYINSWGCVDSHTLVLNPMESIWSATEGANMDPGYDMWDVGGGIPAHTASHGGDAAEVNRIYQETIRKLADRRICFLTVDSEYMRRMDVSGNSLCYKGRSFDTVIAPYMRILDRVVAERLAAFSKAGGRVVFIGRVPDGSPQVGMRDAYVASLMGEILASGQSVICDENELPTDIVPSVSFVDNAFHMVALPRVIEKKRVIWVANNDEVQHSATIRVPKISGRVVSYDPMTDRQSYIASKMDENDTICRITLQALEGRFLFVEPDEKPMIESDTFEILDAVKTIRKAVPEYLPRYECRHALGKTVAEGLRVVIRRMPNGFTAALESVSLTLDEYDVVCSGAWHGAETLEYDNCQCMTINFEKPETFDSVELKGSKDGLPSEYRIEVLRGGEWFHVLTFNDGAPVRWPERSRENPVAEMDYIWDEVIPSGTTDILAENITQSAELFVNGKSVGSRISAPYLFEVLNAIKLGENHFKLRVTGTLTQDAGLSGKISYVKKAKELLMVD